MKGGSESSGGVGDDGEGGGGRKTVEIGESGKVKRERGSTTA